MYHELEVRDSFCQGEWRRQAIDECLIEIVRKAPGGTAVIYDRDECPCWEVNMPYEELLAKLNWVEQKEKVDVGKVFRMDVTQVGEPLAWYPSPCDGKSHGYAFSIEARFVGGFIDTESVRVVK